MPNRRLPFRCELLFFSLIGVFFFSTSTQAQKSGSDNVVIVTSPKPYKVVIDPGHGGIDPGNPRSNKKFLHEKDLNIKIALLVGKYMEERIKGIEVIYTRKTDKKVSLDEVVEIANREKADFFISIHCNYTPIRRVKGTQVHIQNHTFPTTKALAKSIDDQLSKRAGRRSLGVIDRHDRGFNYQILQYTQMPGVLVEAGFMSNPSEEAFLNNGWGQDVIASAIFRGFRDFIMQEKRSRKDDRSTFYKVQVAASKEQTNTNITAYRKLEMRIDEVIDPKSSFKYRYMVGREYKRSHAEELAKKVQKLGFKDAFVVKMPL